MNFVKVVVSEVIKDYEEYYILVCKIFDCNGLVKNQQVEISVCFYIKVGLGVFFKLFFVERY